MRLTASEARISFNVLQCNSILQYPSEPHHLLRPSNDFKMFLRNLGGLTIITFIFDPSHLTSSHSKYSGNYEADSEH